MHYPSLRPYGVFEELQRRGVRIVATEHWTRVQDKSLKSCNLCNLKSFVEKSDAFICVSGGLARAVRELTASERSIHIIPNVANPLFRNVAGEHEGFRFIASGRLVPVKQIDRLVTTFLSAFPTEENVTLTIAGDGGDRRKIAGIIRSAGGRGNRVIMKGTVPREEMAELLLSSDALAVFSRLETFCVPVVEAWLAGKPVIATEVTVAADHPDPRLGRLVHSDDENELKEALRYLYEHKNDYDSKWISDFAAGHFSEEVVAGQILKAYEGTA